MSPDFNSSPFRAGKRTRMVQQSWVIEFLAVEVDEAELQIAIRFGVFAVGMQELLVTAKWYFVVPDYDAIEVLLGIHCGLLNL